MKILSLNKKNDKSLNPNILLTNYCNQNCNFCFAKTIMEVEKTREMPLKEYVELINKLKSEGIKTVYLMGGEPTLHSDFEKVVEETIKLGLKIDLFTNGFFEEKIRKFLLSKKNKIGIYHINITTPDYVNTKKRETINKFINSALKNSEVSLEMTIDELNEEKYLNLIKSVEDRSEKLLVRIGIDGYFLKQGGFNKDKYKKVGELVSNLTQYLVEKGFIKVWLSEVYGCMFDDLWIKKMEGTERVIVSGFGCLSKRGGVDIKTNLKVIRCFSLDALGGLEYKNKKLSKIKKLLDREMVKKSKKNLPLECKKCSKHGYVEGKCPGPCLVGD